MSDPEHTEHEVAHANLLRSFLTAEPPFRRVLLAIGHTVLTVGTLERTMHTVVAGRRAEKDKVGLSEFLSDLQRRSAGQLLNRLRAYGIEESLAEHLADVIERRNALVHHPLEDPHILAAMTRGESATQVAADILTLAWDCDQLIEELQPNAQDDLEGALGITIPGMMSKIELFDASTIQDEAARAQIEAFQEMRRINPIPHPERIDPSPET